MTPQNFQWTCYLGDLGTGIQCYFSKLWYQQYPRRLQQKLYRHLMPLTNLSSKCPNDSEENVLAIKAACRYSLNKLKWNGMGTIQTWGCHIFRLHIGKSPMRMVCTKSYSVRNGTANHFGRTSGIFHGLFKWLDIIMPLAVYNTTT